MPYTQDCHYGFERPHRKEYDEIYPSVDETVVECKNSRCIDYYCRYSLFSGGQIPDSECPFFMRNMRDKVE